MKRQMFKKNDLFLVFIIISLLMTIKTLSAATYNGEAYQYGEHEEKEADSDMDKGFINFCEYESLKDYQKFEELICEANSCIDGASKANKKIILVTGPTRAGKSTIINSFLGNELVLKTNSNSQDSEEEDEDSDNPYNNVSKGSDTKSICLKKHMPNAPSIGDSDVDSETLFPNAYTSKDIKYTLVDTPGFFDSIGNVEKVFASEFVKMSLSVLKIHAIIIVMAKDNLMTGGTVFKQAIAQIGLLFLKMKEKVGIQPQDLHNTFLVINKTTNGTEFDKAKRNLNGLKKTFTELLLN